MKKTNKANFKKIVGGVLAAVMAAAMVATAVIPAFAAVEVLKRLSYGCIQYDERSFCCGCGNCEKEKCVNRGCKAGEDERRRCLSWRHPG